MLTVISTENFIKDSWEITSKNEAAISRFERAREHSDKGHPEEAALWFERTLEEDPKLIAARINLANSKARLKKLHVAIDIYKKVLRIKRNNRISSYNLAIAYILKSEYTKAEKILKRLIKENPDDADVKLIAGHFYLRKGDYEYSIALLEKGVAQGSLLPDGYIDLLYLYCTYQRDYKKVIGYVENATLPESVRKAPLFLNNYAYALIKNGEIEKAEEVLTEMQALIKKTRQQDPNIQISYLATQGLLNFHKNNFKVANKFYARAEQAVSPDIRGLIRQKHLVELGWFSLRSGERRRAEEKWRDALRIDTSSSYHIDFSSEALEGIEKAHEADEQLCRKNGSYFRRIPSGVAVEIPISKTYEFVTLFNKNIGGRVGFISFKRDTHYRTTRFSPSAWKSATITLQYDFLLDSTIIKWAHAELHSGGYGCFLLNFIRLGNEEQERIASSIESFISDLGAE